MNGNEPLPDYYAILQVHPSAEAEIIDVAYRRLMRKYHPDALSPELSSDPEILSRVRSIILAYDVLSDPIQRAAYDAAVAQQGKDAVQDINPEIETRVHLVCCARTKQRFRMLLGRRRGQGTIFHVLGFEPQDVQAPKLEQATQAPALPSPSQPANFLERLLGRKNPNKKDSLGANVTPPKFPAPAVINDIFEESASLNFAEIDFAGHNCPACDGVHTSPDGIISNWCRCGACARIYCSGDIHSTKLGEFTHCPWCGRSARITSHVQPGDRVSMPVKGEIGRSSTARNPKPRLKKPKHPSLPEK